MHEISWLNLWALNQLVCRPESLSQLIHDPVTERSVPHWDFPLRDALRAAPETRLEAVCACIDHGWICGYESSWSSNRHFKPCPSIVTSELRLNNSSQLEQIELIISLEGHTKWQAEFEPDWARFWMCLSEDWDETGTKKTLTIVYAGNDIFDELMQYLPSYW